MGTDPAGEARRPPRLPHALRSLARRDLRLFFAGQAVSLAGTWMASVAQGWLVWRLTRSAGMLGLVNFLGAVPVFLFGVWAGSIADRHARRRVVLATQSNAIVQAALLAALTFGGWVRPWHVLVLSAMLGMTYAFEIPARQALLADLAGEDMPNAIALNSSIVNAARVAGPALAGVVVASVGEGARSLPRAAPPPRVPARAGSASWITGSRTTPDPTSWPSRRPHAVSSARSHFSVLIVKRHSPTIGRGTSSSALAVDRTFPMMRHALTAAGTSFSFPPQGRNTSRKGSPHPCPYLSCSGLPAKA